MRPTNLTLGTLAVLALAALTLTLAVPLLAQAPDGPPGDRPADARGGRLLAKLALYLDLSEEQRAEAETIFTAAREQAAPLREDNRDLAVRLREALAVDPPDPAAVGELVVAIDVNRDELRVIRETAQADFTAILSEEQRLRLEALRDARRIFGRHGRGRGGRGGPAGGGDDAPFGAGLGDFAGGGGAEPVSPI